MWLGQILPVSAPMTGWVKLLTYTFIEDHHGYKVNRFHVIILSHLQKYYIVYVGGYFSPFYNFFHFISFHFILQHKSGVMILKWINNGKLSMAEAIPASSAGTQGKKLLLLYM